MKHRTPPTGKPAMVRYGGYAVPLDIFIALVIRNTTNTTLRFHLQDGEHTDQTDFTLNVIKKTTTFGKFTENGGPNG